MSLLVPGDQLHCENTDITGAGVYLAPEHIVENKLIPINAGLEVNQTKNGKNITLVEYNSKRYTPAVGDYVVGLVSQTYGNYFVVSVANFSSTCVLPFMAFPNASKKNKPKLKTGDLVYARVSKAHPNLPAELECMDSSTGAKEGFGLLEEENALVIDISLAFARELLFNLDYPLLPELSKVVEFEVAIGVNGKLWIKTADTLSTLACYKIVSEAEHASPAQFHDIIKNNSKMLKKIAST